MRIPGADAAHFKDPKRVKIAFENGILTLVDTPSKQTSRRLAIFLPNDYTLDSVHFSTAGDGSLGLSGIIFGELFGEGWNGKVSLDNCTASKVTIETINGDVDMHTSRLQGAGYISISTITGNVALTKCTAKTIDVKTFDGRIALTDCDIQSFRPNINIRGSRKTDHKRPQVTVNGEPYQH